MRSITHKIETLRRAVAESRIQAQPDTIKRLLANDVPKKDILPIARAAGVMAAKKTPDLLPYCHPILIDWVQIEFETQETLITIRATVEAVAKTGVEMETLTAASVAALTVYDMLKPIDDSLEILGAKLLKKTGGKSGFKEIIPPGFKTAVIVTSDSTSRGTRSDKSGRLIVEKLRSFGLEPDYQVIADEKILIASAMSSYCEEGVDLVMTTGGTGLSGRDVTVEATEAVIDRVIPGIMEAARSHGQRRTPYAMLSRGLAGQKGKTLIINLPGSSKGVEESLDALFPALFHAYGMMKGLGHEVNT
ncbi:MAG: bifunctional molybdenum cofactor biosynthesis protein MoaC/MoaB [Candidatus Omnitrophica bacterium]|nr:bifunctional molybdenum cofactor biosynthesis protein MoaC/MoaB [Candidatus Omnitrophota bacterium]